MINRLFITLRWKSKQTQMLFFLKGKKANITFSVDIIWFQSQCFETCSAEWIKKALLSILHVRPRYIPKSILSSGVSAPQVSSGCATIQKIPNLNREEHFTHIWREFICLLDTRMDNYRLNNSDQKESAAQWREPAMHVLNVAQTKTAHVRCWLLWVV